MTNRVRYSLLVSLIPLAVSAQIDPVNRDLIQLGYNSAFQGHAPLAGYAFFYHNAPGFLRTNLTLRVALAPVYVDSELGISHALGEHTDLGIGLAGGASSASSYAASTSASACCAAASSRACTSARTSPVLTASPRFARQRMPTAWSMTSSFVWRPAPMRG